MTPPTIAVRLLLGLALLNLVILGTDVLYNVLAGLLSLGR
jgi:hypothetical protein